MFEEREQLFDCIPLRNGLRNIQNRANEFLDTYKVELSKEENSKVKELLIYIIEETEKKLQDSKKSNNDNLRT